MRRPCPRSRRAVGVGVALFDVKSTRRKAARGERGDSHAGRAFDERSTTRRRCIQRTSSIDRRSSIPRTLHCVLLTAVFFALLPATVAQNSKDSSRLYETLLSDYNKLVRPVHNNTETLVVKFKLKLSQLLDVHEKNQIMTTNVWLQHSWVDQKLTWDPADYGGVDVLYVPSDSIWLPGIVLHNNADGNYQVTIMTKAKLTYDGTVEWSPPAIYKSMCQIDIEWFPLDVQSCEMKFGSWTYGGFEVDLKHKDEHLQREEREKVMGIDGEFYETIWVVDEGIDLNDYYPSVEWDILRVPAKRHEKRYPCCESPFTDLTYEIHLRRKTLFYTVNLMIPCVGISFLTALVFYLPSDGGEKISLCISILISLTVFFLLLVEIIPSTSLVIPLIGKYLLFTMVLVTLSVIVTVITLNVHYRSPSTHKMSPWVRRVFIDILPYYLLMRRPTRAGRTNRSSSSFYQPPDNVSNLTMQLMPTTVPGAGHRRSTRNSSFSLRSKGGRNSTVLEQSDYLSPTSRLSDAFVGSSRGSVQQEPTPMQAAVESVSFIADHFRKEEEDQQVIEDWKYVSVVLDRIMLILFTFVCFAGTLQIIFRAPTIYDNTPALA
ncbi:Acetylcholine receptor subunit alpha-type unc-63 [Aphelenchoides fujianensis]|nr:Acetylcholine receptor subunit alpha-type unc-63 [Aphelenchoides fujianensis]